MVHAVRQLTLCEVKRRCTKAFRQVCRDPTMECRPPRAMCVSTTGLTVPPTWLGAQRQCEGVGELGGKAGGVKTRVGIPRAKAIKSSVSTQKHKAMILDKLRGRKPPRLTSRPSPSYGETAAPCRCERGCHGGSATGHSCHVSTAQPLRQTRRLPTAGGAGAN